MSVCVSPAAYRNLGQNLWGPHRYGCLNDVEVSCVVSGPCAAHSLLITTEGKLWSWGKCPHNSSVSAGLKVTAAIVRITGTEISVLGGSDNFSDIVKKYNYSYNTSQLLFSL